MVTIRNKLQCLSLASLLLTGAAQAGILVTRDDRGLQFTNAFSLNVNGKDKAMSLGAQPKINGPVNKLPQARIEGTLLKDAGSKVIALYDDGAITFLIPRAQKEAAPDPAALWVSARISYKKAANDKTPSDIAASSFVAFLPEGLEQLVRICNDGNALQVLGGKGQQFGTQLEWITAVAKAYASDPAAAPLARYVAQAMRQRYQQFESGLAGVESLDQALKFAELSAAVYPNDAGQQELRKVIQARRAWLDRKMAVLRAFAAARDWDAFLLGDRDFESYQHAFPEMLKMHTEALNRSLQLHQQAGEERRKDHEYGPAYREFLLASLRHPSDSTLQQNVMMSWTDYSREAAIAHQGKRKQLSAGEQAALAQNLLFATRFKEQNKLDEAIRYVKEAEKIDPGALPVLLKKAEVLGAQHEIGQALAVLNQYDLLAIDEERKKSETLRSELLFQLTSTVQDAKAQFDKAWTSGSFHRAREVALEGLRAKDTDADLLYDAGAASLITRDYKDSRRLFARYLEVSNTLDANAEQRAKVRRLLAGAPETVPAETGDPNWLSGKKLPKDVFYCPVSLAFQIPVERIEASNKMKLVYEWNGAKLKSIDPVFEKNERSTGERRISFAYDEQFPQVTAVAYDSDVRPAGAASPDDRLKSATPLLPNNPYGDPAAIQKLAGKNVAIGISGNRFFHPFIWDKIHYFQITYDSEGRMSTAREIASPGSAPGNQWLEFEWDGPHLIAVRGYEGAENRRAKIYERTMQYQDGRLISEEIQSQGKTSHIKYNYNGGRLVSANCDRDASLDDRSRQVFFR